MGGMGRGVKGGGLVWRWGGNELCELKQKGGGKDEVEWEGRERRVGKRGREPRAEQIRLCVAMGGEAGLEG